MAVSIPFNTTAWVRDSADTTLDLAMTIDSGHTNTYLHVWVVWIGATTVSALAWDTAGGGANQALASKIATLDFGALMHIEGWGLANPTAGAAKTITITMSGTSDIMICGAVYDTAAGTLNNRNSNTTGAAITINATSGDVTTTCIATSNSVTGTDKSLIATGSFVLDVGCDYSQASGNVTHTWTASGATQAVLGAAIQQAATGRTTHNTTSNPLGLALGTNRGIGA